MGRRWPSAIWGKGASKTSPVKPWSHTPSLQDSEQINFCLSYSIWGTFCKRLSKLTQPLPPTLIFLIVKMINVRNNIYTPFVFFQIIISLLSKLKGLEKESSFFTLLPGLADSNFGQVPVIKRYNLQLRIHAPNLKTIFAIFLGFTLRVLVILCLYHSSVI